MAAKKKRTKEQNKNRNIKEILGGKISVTALELIRLIHWINPTREDVDNDETKKRYRLKAQLQSLLIHKFKNNLIVMPDPDNPDLVSLRLRHFDDNACHAMIQELDQESRSWVKMEMDINARDRENTSSPPKNQPSPSLQIAKDSQARETYSSDELLTLGTQALEAYDYDACEDFLFRAFFLSQGSLPATRALLEFLVDYLAAHERAVELEASLSQECKKDPLVSAKLAMALACTNRMEEALALVGRNREAFAMPVYALGVEDFISRNDLDGAERLCRILSSSQDHGFVLQGAALLEKIEKMRLDSLVPLEQEMTALWHKKQFKQANRIALNILETVPAHQGARKISGEFTRMQQREKTVEFMELADRAKSEKDFSREAMFLKKAMDINPDETQALTIKSRIEMALNKNREQREHAQIHEVEVLWQKGERKNALMGYFCLSPEQQEECRSLIKDVCLAWTDELKAAFPSIKPEKAAGAVLALIKASKMMAENKDPIHVLLQMEDVRETLVQIKEGRKLLDRVKKLIKAREIERSKKLLDRAVQLLEQDRITDTREVIDTIRPELLDIREQQKLQGLTTNLVKYEQIQNLEQTHKISLDRQDYFTAREAALKIALLVETDQEENPAKDWRKNAEEETDLIRKSWAMVELKEPELSDSIWTVGLHLNSDGQTCAALMPDGCHIILISNLGSRIFIRMFDYENQRFDRAVIVSPPLQMNFPRLCLKGETIWIGGGEAGVFSMTLDPLDILFWKDCSSFVEKDHVVENISLFPRHNSLWLHVRPMGLTNRETTRVIDLEQYREVRRIKNNGLQWNLNHGGDLKMSDTSFETNTIIIYSGSGRQEKSLVKTIPGYVEKSVIHPDGKRIIALIYNEAGEAYSISSKDLDTCDIDGLDEPLDALYLEVLPTQGDSPVSIQIPFSNGQVSSDIATSMKKSLVFVHCQVTENNEEKPHLFAFKVHGDKFEEIYKVGVPPEFFFAVDELCLEVMGVVPGKNGIQSIMLGFQPPRFSFKDVLPELTNQGIPIVDKYSFCSMATGRIYDLNWDYKKIIDQSSLKAVHKMFKNMKQETNQFPEDLFAFYDALSDEHIYPGLVNEVQQWIQERFPDHPRTLMLRADRALENLDWSAIISLLKDVELQGVDDGTAGHICHLLGLALFSTGEVKDAITVWNHGKGLRGSKCRFDEFIGYGKFAAMSDLDRKKAKTRGEYPEILKLIETMDSFLDLGNWKSVIKEALCFGINSITNSQIQARIAKALLNLRPDHGGKEWLEKVILLNFFIKKSKDPLFTRLCLPPYMVTWPETQIQAIAEEATLWLERQQ